MSTPSTLAPRRRGGDCGGAVAAAQIEDVDALGDPDSIDERFAAFAHARRDAGEVAFLPERLVRIHRRSSASFETIDCCYEIGVPMAVPPRGTPSEARGRAACGTIDEIAAVFGSAKPREVVVELGSLTSEIMSGVLTAFALLAAMMIALAVMIYIQARRAGTVDADDAQPSVREPRTRSRS